MLAVKAVTRILAVSAVLLSCVGSTRAQDATWTPDRQAIDELESAVQLPAWGPSRAHPVAEYARYYAGIVSNGRHLILAEFVGLGGMYVAGIHLVASRRDFPVIFDGGCAIINLRYDADAKRIEKLACNGQA